MLKLSARAVDVPITDSNYAARLQHAAHVQNWAVISDKEARARVSVGSEKLSLCRDDDAWHPVVVVGNGNAPNDANYNAVIKTDREKERRSTVDRPRVPPCNGRY